MTDEEIRKLSVKRIVSEHTFDALGHPVSGGLYDPALGPHDPFSSCQTCSLPFHLCPGHSGHIQLEVPVFNPVMFPLLYDLLNSKCFHCHRLRASAKFVCASLLFS